MNKKKIGVATLYTNAAEFYCKQIESLFSDYVTVEKYCFDDRSIEKGIQCDLVVILSYTIFDAVKKYIQNDSEIIIMNRSLSNIGFEKIKSLPEGTKAMLVNVSAEMAIETISLIYQLGLRHIALTPVYPEIKELPDMDIAITPGEEKYVPNTVKKVINIGDRVLDMSCITDIAVKLGLDHMLITQKFRDYFKSIVPVSFGLEKILGNSNRLESYLDVLLQILDEGIIGVNAKGMIYSYNESAENIMSFRREKVIGSYAVDLFPQIPFDTVLSSFQSEKEKIIKINGYDVVVTVHPIVHLNTLYGAVAIVRKFSDIEKKQHKLRAQLIHKGHRAKYQFKDILGNSKSIHKCKNIAMRMAKSDSSVLIMGESGTGKELFAQAIHNYSRRKNYQFVAINCAALPENLLESELFGYEEGAFTGAKKGGKIGLFELAHMGTLFLDEIGELSINLQARLLRVLQERAVMRIGGDRLINVDVRIISATNRDLKKLVKEGLFRQDLYFRLNVLPLRIPPLRERKEDILPLIIQMKKQFHGNFELTPKAVEKFLQHNWEGNVRELSNYIEYLAHLGEKEIDDMKLPFGDEEAFEDVFLDDDEKQIIERFRIKFLNQMDTYIFVLKELENGYRDRKRLGRRSIYQIASQKGLFLSEQEIRRILIDLESYNMVEIFKGRGGTKITDFGKRVLKYLTMG
ncbi:sigma-54 interaction domain-containing protein [Crassaminicella thermophila]|uniref:sigma-54 interaction domain-containing protein n=1 Tax=Crassaminicella thermophila TaxID=2599308 RepID=UPI001E51C95A|nr:sigma 54-interacting transcriptional regulator [Crassaminicella thermophila]